jgi:hypothetical protein
MFLLENSEGYKEKSVDAIQVEDPWQSEGVSNEITILWAVGRSSGSNRKSGKIRVV